MATHGSVTNQAASHQPPGDLLIRFWGVRGSIPTPGAATNRYGGNTPCVEILSGAQQLIFDGGTGLRMLGEALHTQPFPISAHLFFTSSQWDRIQGFPFFLPAFNPGNCFHIYGGTAVNGASIKQCLTTQMLKPGFTLPLQAMQASLDFNVVRPGSRICLDETTVEAIGLNSQVNAFGYRISYRGRSIVYATDTNPEQVDENLVYLAEDADVMIYDGTYADLSDQGAYQKSPKPWDTALKLKQAARVKYLVLFHHGPRQTDAHLDRLAARLAKITPQVSLAREGMVIDLSQLA